MTTTSQSTISAKLINNIAERLAQGKQVRCKIHKNGLLRIDQQLPFLCVYRQPNDFNDIGTSQLIRGQAAYLKTTADPDLQTDVASLVQKIVKVQSDLYGSFLLIELWVDRTEYDADILPVKPAFHICAPRQQVPTKILDTFENALLGFYLDKQKSGVTLSYQDECQAPGTSPLISSDTAAQFKCITLGLAIKPVYLDQENGEVLPFAMNALRRSMSHALKKVCYSFSHSCTHYRPVHYHELGQRVMTKTVWDSDRKLANISERFDLLLHVTPVNANEAWHAYQQRGYNKIPEFHYRPRNVDPALLKRELYQIPIERIEDPTLALFFADKRNELDRQISLLNDRNTPQFLHGSIQLFGKVEIQLLESAKRLLAPIGSANSNQEEKIIDAEQLAIIARKEVEHYFNKDSSLATQVELRNDITGLMVSHGDLLIGTDAHVAQSKLKAALNHEIGTHALTYHNGRKQPLRQLYAGTTGYEELQEGLAVLAEYLCGGLDIPRLQFLAARAIAVHSIISGADFIETFRLLHHDYNLRPYTAFNITMRVYRGGGYTKDVIYLRGFINLLDYLKKDDDLDILYCGKIAMEQLPLIKELHWRKVIQPPAIMPRYLSDSDAQQRLTKLKAKPTLQYVMENM